MFTPSGHRGKTQEEFIQDLRDGTTNDQRKALESLAMIGDADALDEIIHYLQANPDQTGQALKTLNVLSHKYFPESRYDLSDVVLPYLKTSSWMQRLIAVRIFNTHPSELIIDGLNELIEEGLEKLAEEEQKKFSFSKGQIDITISEAISALANSGKTLVLPDMISWLDEPNTRIAAVRGLGLIGAETERNRLFDLAEDRDPRVRDAAQWSLSLMDDRQSQLDIPPDQIPEPPPERLSPIYWAHRQLVASEEDEIVQLLVVRIAIELLILDTFINQGRALDTCHIILREYHGDEPPEPGSTDTSHLTGVWFYQWQGPILGKSINPEPRLPIPNTFFTRSNWPGPTIAIYYPDTLLSEGDGLISTDLFFDPQYGRGFHYRLVERDGKWIFSLVKKTWST